MKRRLFCFVVCMLALCMSVQAEIEMEGELVRLHVVADSDSWWAQQVKLQVRDACLACAEDLLDSCENADEAFEVLRENLPKFEEAAYAAAENAGYMGMITLETGVFDFPDRIYGELLVPSGEYMALRVTLGAGEGHNWWCVLYPSLCALDENEYAARQEGNVTYYSIIGQWIRNLLERLG